ncbi:MAG TPA: dienelactone hydrolase family protein [Vicinamibacteria bacterium]|nr:dienelactone hydrolase family protein [Vicinamibacteria bacterium]
MMGEDIALEASDGHELRAYRASPAGRPKGGIIVLQEIFGVNAHIREVADGFSADGYLVLAPSLYDRSSRKNVRLGYTQDDIAEGRRLREEFSWEDSIRDVGAAADALRSEDLKVGVVGYCWGGSVAFLAAVRLPLDAAVVYYGGQIMPHVNERELGPLLMHFGTRDASIPLSDVEAIRKAHPQATVHLYDADHGFNCNYRPQFDQSASTLARERTLAFFASHLV